MQKRTYAIVGDKVLITHNINYRGTIIPNGAIGRVTSIDKARDAVVADIIKPTPMNNITFERHTSPAIMCGNTQLRRIQMPLELACAQTIHGAQGDTEEAIATRIDDEWKNKMWEREMLFTLLTRVGKLEDIYFAGYQYACVK